MHLGEVEVDSDRRERDHIVEVFRPAARTFITMRSSADATGTVTPPMSIIPALLKELGRSCLVSSAVGLRYSAQGSLQFR